MPANELSNFQISTAYDRILRDLSSRYESETTPARWSNFTTHFSNTFPTLMIQLYSVYQQEWDFYYHLDRVCNLATRFWLQHHTLNNHHSNWFEQSDCVGASAYVDLFAGNIAGLEDRIDYLKELGISYLHLMPLFDVPNGDSDGGYAIRDFGKVNPNLGSVTDLKKVKNLFQKNNIKLVLDFVFNHVSDQHEWAVQAKQGDPKFKNFFWLFNHPQDKEVFAPHLRDIFPDKRPGCFTYSEELKADIWTTFNSYQWDLNYSNPEVFTYMCQELLKVVDAGADVVRLDALAFIWKEPGTSCENLPKAHTLIKTFNAFLSLAAPFVILKSEAIVAPDEVIKYIAPEECPISYNPNLMALLWEALATRQTQLLIEGTRNRTDLPAHTNWVNYLRCHDDIGWAFADQDAWNRGINPFDHRQFLNAYYTGQFEGSFAKGVPFQYNPENGDCRISGTLASLTGVHKETPVDDLAIKRIILLHGVLMAFKGIPLIYLGDELAILNDFSYSQKPEQFDDSRWVHRVPYSATKAERRHQPGTIEHQVFSALQRQITVRANNEVFGNGEIHIPTLAYENLFVFQRLSEDQQVTIIANFSEHIIELQGSYLRRLGLNKPLTDLLSGMPFSDSKLITIHPYDIYWLSPDVN